MPPSYAQYKLSNEKGTVELPKKLGILTPIRSIFNILLVSTGDRLPVPVHDIDDAPQWTLLLGSVIGN